jgi:hypothetical protein
MTPDQEHAALLDVIAWIDQRLSTVNFELDRRGMLTAGCLDVAIEHQAAIATLYSGKLYGSMVALLRVVAESTVRGIWLSACATDEQLEAFTRGRIGHFGQLIDEIEGRIGNANKTLSNFKVNAWSAMNDFTHTGYQQVIRRHGPGILGQNYPDSEICKALSVAGALGLIAAAHLAAITNSGSLVEEMTERMWAYAKRTEGLDPNPVYQESSVTVR